MEQAKHESYSFHVLRKIYKAMFDEFLTNIKINFHKVFSNTNTMLVWMLNDVYFGQKLLSIKFI